MLENEVREEYARRRQVAELACEHRVATLISQFPEVQEFKNKINNLRLRLIYLQITKASVDLAQEQADLVTLESEYQNYLQSNQIDADFDKPSYQCELCSDQGYTEVGPCQCHQALLAQLVGWPKQEQIIDDAYFNNFDLRLIKIANRDLKGLNSVAIKDLLQRNNNSDTINDVAHLRLEAAYLWSQYLLADWQNKHYLNGYFYGATGTGKSFLAGCILHAVRDQNRSAIFIVANDLFDNLYELRLLRQTFNPNYQRLNELLEFEKLIFAVDFLVIDDLGTESLNIQAKIPIFLRIFNERILPKRTIITSNLTPEDIKSYYDERIFSRLTKDYIKLEFSGIDLRNRSGV